MLLIAIMLKTFSNSSILTGVYDLRRCMEFLSDPMSSENIANTKSRTFDN